LTELVQVHRPDDVQWTNLGIDDAKSDLVSYVVAGPASPQVAGEPGFASGFVDFEELEMDFTVTYDESCYVIEGEIGLTPAGGEEVVVGPGEVFEIHYGTEVHVRVPARCRIFYAAYPADFLEQHQSELNKLGKEY
jgi:uncharacterized cupin superfamily protein